MKIGSRFMQDYEEELFALEIELKVVRQERYRLRVLLKRLSDESDGKVYRQAISELRQLEYSGKVICRRRDEIVHALKVSKTSKATSPPQLGERILLLILTKDERINIPGDLEEEYAEIATKHGARFAKTWYYKQVVASAWPMIGKALRFGLYIWIGEWIRQRIK